MHDFAFADAARPRKLALLGVTLFDYTIGHEILLLHTRNPFLCLTGTEFAALPLEQQIAAALSGATICSRTWQANQIARGFFKSSPKAATDTDWPAVIVAFAEYLSAAHAGFPGPDPEADTICAKTTGYEPMKSMRGRSLGAPITAQLINFCLDRPAMLDGCTSVYDMPYALTAALYRTHLEMEGATRIENEDEAQMRAFLAQAKEETQPMTPPASTGLATEPPKL